MVGSPCWPWRPVRARCGAIWRGTYRLHAAARCAARLAAARVTDPSPPSRPQEEHPPLPHRGLSHRLSAAASRLGSLLMSPESSGTWMDINSNDPSPDAHSKGSLPAAAAAAADDPSDRLEKAETAGTEAGDAVEAGQVLQPGGKQALGAAPTFGSRHGVLVSEDTFRKGEPHTHRLGDCWGCQLLPLRLPAAPAHPLHAHAPPPSRPTAACSARAAAGYPRAAVPRRLSVCSGRQPAPHHPHRPG